MGRSKSNILLLKKTYISDCCHYVCFSVEIHALKTQVSKYAKNAMPKVIISTLIDDSVDLFNSFEIQDSKQMLFINSVSSIVFISNTLHMVELFAEDTLLML